MNEQTRKQKRLKRIKVNGNVMRITTFIRQRAKDLPVMKDGKTGLPVDHARNLKGMYMSKGVEGVNEYVRGIQSVVKRDAGKTFWQRLAGRCELLMYKVRR